MSVVLQEPWTIERFLDWVTTQDVRHEFDGVRPVAMVGGTVSHSRITGNILVAFRHRLRGTPCAALGPDLGVQTADDSVRYPDALITCTKLGGTERLAPAPIAVFEVLSPGSGRRDRIDKAREYAGIPSLLHYVILETSRAGLVSLHRESGEAPWTETPLTAADTLTLSTLGIEIPVAEFYEDVDWP